jgi:uncharacterized protein YndB with AHSA1/START domain
MGASMARVTMTVDATAQDVFAVLADADSYGEWVVGSDTIRDADAGFPAKGTRFHHRVGVGLLKTNDHTEVLEADPPFRLELHAKARPAGSAHVTLLMTPRDGGRTDVTMIETAGDLLSRLVFNPLTDPLVKLRNVESLRRLKRLAEARATAAAAGR